MNKARNANLTFIVPGLNWKRRSVNVGHIRPNSLHIVTSNPENFLKFSRNQIDQCTGECPYNQKKLHVMALDSETGQADKRLLYKANHIPEKSADLGLDIYLQSVGKFIDGYIASRTDVTEQTRINLKQTRRRLDEYGDVSITMRNFTID